jgi:hypothetical protein
MFWKGQHVRLICSLLLLLEFSLHRVEIRLVWYGENWTFPELLTTMEYVTTTTTSAWYL